MEFPRRAAWGTRSSRSAAPIGAEPPAAGRVPEDMKGAILIVEDEILVALEIENILEEQGYTVLGIAADLDGALAYAHHRIDLALVDLNLRDGLTGLEIGATLARDHQVGVLFLTANPRLLGDGVAGTIGVLTKPTDEAALTSAVAFAMRRLSGVPAEPPRALRCFG
jgi:DNA-binding response OmpR family regulator